MSKSTKLLIAALGLGGLGYFLYKKGLFSNASSVTPLVNNPTPTPPPTTTPTKKSCPQGQELVSVNCIVAPCPDICMPIKTPIVAKDPIIGTPIIVETRNLPNVDNLNERTIYVKDQIYNMGNTNAEINTLYINNDYKLGINDNYNYK